MQIDALTQLPLQSTQALDAQSATFYVTEGQGDLLVLVHGSLCDLRYWRWQLRQVSPFCQVLALSLPGYWPNNPSISAYEFNLENQIAALHDVIKQNQKTNQNVYVLGHSRGAQVALQYALRHPTTLSGLLLADPAITPSEPQIALPVLHEAAELLAQGKDTEGLSLFIDAVSGKNTWQQMVGWFKTMVENNAHTLIAQSREELPTIETADLSAISELPLLLITGALSPERYQHSAALLAKHLPKSAQVQIANASHGMNLAKPKSFNQAVTQFMQTISAAA